MEPAAEVIMHASGRHAAEGCTHHLERFLVPLNRCVAQEVKQSRRAREFRCASEPSPAFIEASAQLPISGVEQLSIKRLSGRVAVGNAAKLLRDVRARTFNRMAVFLPDAREVLQQLPETGTAVAIVGWEVGSTEEWLQFGREPDGHGPPATSCIG